jgi:hypothetical protein
MHGADAGGDDTELGIALVDLERTLGLVPGRDLGQLLAQTQMRRLGIGRDHDPHRHVAFEMRLGQGLERRTRTDHGFGVTDARGQPQDDRDLPALRQLQPQPGEVIGLLRVDGFEHRQGGGTRIVPVVLFVLAGGHAGVVGRDHQQTAFDVGIGGGEQRIGGHIQPDVLHGDDGACTGEGAAEADLERDLFVRRPLRATAELVEGFQDLSGRCAGVSRPQPDSGMQCRQRDGIVATQ